MKRAIIKIDEEKCNGCGACISGCHEGALQLINGKAVMVNEQHCDGLGACIGDCPVGAITLEEREAEPFNDVNNSSLKEDNKLACGCPGTMMREIKPPVVLADLQQNTQTISQPSELRQFPVQLQLLNPHAAFFKKANVLLAADCTAFASGEFHGRFLKGKTLSIACPKLDSNIENYVFKLVEMIDVAEIDTLTLLLMEVPCCSGLVRIAEMARTQAKRHIPLKIIILSVQGEVQSEKWS